MAAGDSIAHDTALARCDAAATQARAEWLKQYVSASAGR
jgi:hypothetical protein